MLRNKTLDIVKILLSFMIVAIHCGFLSEYSLHTYYIVTNSFFRIALPLFFLINGYYLFSFLEKRTIKTWLKKNTLIYLFLMLLYAYFWIDTSNLNLFKFTFKILFGYFHLWYLPAMILGSLLLFYIKSFSNRNIVIASLVLFLVGITIQYSARFHYFSEYLILDKSLNILSFYRNFLFIGFPFISLGYLINKTRIDQKINHSTILFFTLIFIALFALENTIIQNGLIIPIVEFQISYWIGAPLIFIMILRNSKYDSTKSLVSFYAMIIYFIHPLLLQIVLKITAIKPTLLTFIVFIAALVTTFFILQLKQSIYKRRKN